MVLTTNVALVASSMTSFSYAALVAAFSKTMEAVWGCPSGIIEAARARERERMLPTPPLPEDFACDKL